MQDFLTLDQDLHVTDDYAACTFDFATGCVAEP